MNILILEDERIHREGLVRLLQSRYPDYTIAAADCYDCACELALSETFDLFILDVQLGNPDDRNGYDFANYIRHIQRYFTTPIMFTTGFPDYMESAINKIHCYSYLSKPYDIDRICEAIDSLEQPKAFPIKCTDGKYYTVSSATILYAEVFGHVLTIHCEERDIRTREYSISVFCKIFPDLVQCHKKLCGQC